MKENIKSLFLAGVSLALASAGAFAHSGHTGRPNDTAAVAPKEVKSAPRVRTIEVSMLDAMRFVPANIDVQAGEAVRFVVRNLGLAPHELVLGSPEELTAHAAEMIANPHAMHDGPGAVRVSPGESKEFSWTFTRPGTVEFGCLLPGHFVAGMVGVVRVGPASPPAAEVR